MDCGSPDPHLNSNSGVDCANDENSKRAKTFHGNADMTDVDQEDPRDPREVVVQQGINPNPGPTKRIRCSDSYYNGGWTKGIFLLLVYVILGCADAGAVIPWAGREIVQRRAEGARPPPPQCAGVLPHHGDHDLGQRDRPGGSGRRPRRPGDGCEGMINVSNVAPRLGNNHYDTIKESFTRATSVLGALAGVLAAASAGLLVRHKRAGGSSRDSCGCFSTTKMIIEALRTSGTQPRRYDPRQRRLYRLRKAMNRHEQDKGSSKRDNVASYEASKKSIGRVTRVGRGKLGFLGRLLVLLILIVTASAAPLGDGGLAARRQPLENGYNMLWSNEKRQEEVSNELRAMGRTCTADGRAANLGSEELCNGDERNGPENSLFEVLTANVHSLGPRTEVVAQWDSDIVLMQETKLAPHAIRDATTIMKNHGWTFLHGRPCRPPKVRKDAGRTAAPTEATSGGVAAMVKRPSRPIDPQKCDTDRILYDSGRWMEIRTPIRGGSCCLVTACFYGIAGASSYPAKHRQNEQLLARAVKRAIDSKDEPYLLVGDFNVEPESSPSVAAAIEAGLLVDVGHTWAEEVMDKDGQPLKIPHPTYRNGVPEPGMGGPNTSRIDAVLANPAAAAAVKAFDLRWDLTQEKHVPLQVTLDVGELGALEVVQDTKPVAPIDKLPHKDDEKWDAAYKEVKLKYASKYRSAIDKGDVDLAHEIWCYMAEECLCIAGGMSPSEAEAWVKSFHPRGRPPRFKKRKRAKPVDKLGHPATCRQRQLTNTKNRVLELKHRLQRCEREADDGDPWTERARRGFDVPAEIDLWNKIADKARRLVGNDRLQELVGDYGTTLPNAADLAKLADFLAKEHTDVGSKRRKERKLERRIMAKWDWEHNHGRRAYATARVPYAPPTFALKDPKDDKKYIMGTERVHDEFLHYWKEIFCAPHPDRRQWESFFQKYGEYVPTAPYQDQRYRGHHFTQQLERMKDSAAGFDGWTRAALRCLPEQLWDDRAELENRAKELGVVPTAYLHVPTPMLPKGQACRPEQHRGIVVFSMIHRVVMGTVWHHMRDWQEQWLDPCQHGGRAGGEHLADAWDLQLQIESANAGDDPLVGALLDYSKFFDRFHPELIKELLIRAGAPPTLANQLHFIYSRLRRYVKVADSLGAVILQNNGAAQGCSLSIVIANIYVATLFRYLRATHPEVDLGAFLDDRNMTASTVEKLEAAVRATSEFDRWAGHKTNVEKSVAFATRSQDKKKLKMVKIDGAAMSVAANATMVGHDIAVKRGRNVAFLTGRTQMATQRARKVGNMVLTRRQKTRLVQSAVIPSASSGALWDIPSVKSLTTLRSAIADAVWGKGRKQRCVEILLTVIHDPTQTDPLAAIIYKRLRDARRLMKKDETRKWMAVHTYEMTVDDADGEPNDVFPKTQGPVKGMRQAAALVGGSLVSTADGFVISFPDGRPDFPINTGPDGPWKIRAKEIIRTAITKQLNRRLIPPSADLPQAEKRKGRQDLHGIGEAVDHYATRVNLEGRSAKVAKDHAEIWVASGMDPECGKYKNDEIWNQRLQATITGAHRAPDRLFNANLISSPACAYCPCPRATLQHVVWECPKWAEKRASYLEALNAYGRKLEAHDGERARQWRDLLQLQCVRNCGVVPEAEYFIKGGSQIPIMCSSYGKPNVNVEDLPPRVQAGMVRDAEGRLCAFTDGTAVCPQDPRRRRAAWAVFYTPDCPLNVGGPVDTAAQTVYRAELTAAAHVILSAVSPTCIVSDCEAVVDQLRDELAMRRRPLTGDHRDLWMTIRDAIDRRESGFFDVQWVKSHLDPQKAEEIEQAGGFPAEHIWGNAQADAAAKNAMGWHEIDWAQYALADDREVAACIIQRLITDVWSSFFEEDPSIKRHEQDCDENDDHTTVIDQLNMDDEAPGQDTDPNPKDAPPTVLDPMTLNNRDLADFIKTNTPDYDWQDAIGEECDVDDITIQGIPEGCEFENRGQTWIQGKGMVSTAFAYPPHYLEPVLWWWNRLKWRKRPGDAVLNEPTNSATYLEAVIDMEQATGFYIGSDGACKTTWSEKARVLAYIVRTLARIGTVTVNGAESNLKRAVGPRTDVSSLTPLGGTVMSGYGRKPIWVYRGTPELAAVNVWRARNADRTGPASTNTGNQRKRTFARDWMIDRDGYPPNTEWCPRAVRELRDLINKRRTEDGNSRPERGGQDTTQSSALPSHKRQRRDEPERVRGAKRDHHAACGENLVVPPERGHRFRGRQFDAATEDDNLPSWLRNPPPAEARIAMDSSRDPHVPLPTVTRSQKRAHEECGESSFQSETKHTRMRRMLNRGETNAAPNMDEGCSAEVRGSSSSSGLSKPAAARARNRQGM